MSVVSCGTNKHHENFPSKFVTVPNVDVSLPNGYTTKKNFNVVLQVHGRQMQFDSATTCNHHSCKKMRWLQN